VVLEVVAVLVVAAQVALLMVVSDKLAVLVLLL
jgi:hypothetical protein